MKIEIDLTPDETEKLEDVFNTYQDEWSPQGGWHSPVLSGLSSKVFGAITDAKMRRDKRAS